MLTHALVEANFQRVMFRIDFWFVLIFGQFLTLAVSQIPHAYLAWTEVFVQYRNPAVKETPVSHLLMQEVCANMS